MPDKPLKTPDSGSSRDPSADNDEANWGEDWESAFQSEDEQFFSEVGGEDDFFLDEKELTTGTKSSGPDLAASLEASLANIPDKAGDEAKSSSPSFSASKIHSLLTGLLVKASTFWLKLQALHLSIRIPLYLLPIISVGFFIFFAVLDTEEKIDSGLQQTQGASSTHLAGEKTPPPVDATIGTASPRAFPEKVRKKWAFSPFLIPSPPASGGQATSFVSVQITLVAALDADENLPEEKKIFVRDLIYQFYLNRPGDELRRFSLARGEMNMKLLAWLTKQWPEGPIESIIFERYTLS